MTGLVRAPQLDVGLGWLNTDRPLRFGQELAGQVVVLDFWTYCCINCMHILPDLAYLEHKYRNHPVVFIGVHSAKFPNESSRETIRSAILRYEIQHPVVIDDGMKIWRSYAARSWPTLLVVDPTGSIVLHLAGEGNRNALDQAIEQALAQARSAGTLASAPLTLRREANVRATSGLAFPGKVLADLELDRLFVADSNHNRIVVAQLPDERGRCRVLKVVGGGAIGASDGPAHRATFNHPQGLVTGLGNLYVADTENHLIRAIHLETYEVTTIVGTGEMTYDFAGGGMGTAQGINSPWDLVREGSTLYVAMAGTHQIWRIDLPVGFARALAGSGRENIVDGPTETSALAQPSGICSLGGRLYFADSEVSAIRGIDLAVERVFTVIGEGLFSFGDVDGAHPKAQLQHPLGLAAWGSSLIVADTYNHKIKVVDPGARSARTILGAGKPATSTDAGGPAFFEPGGLCVAGDLLFVADTNNHRIVRINLKTHVWNEIVFEGLECVLKPLSPTEGEGRVRGSSDAPLSAPTSACEGDIAAIDAEGVSVADGTDIELLLDVQLPTAAHLNAEAPWSVRVSFNGETLAQQTGRSTSMPVRIVIPAPRAGGSGDWRVEFSFTYCTEGEGQLCIPRHLVWIVPVRGGGNERRVALRSRVDR